MSAFCITEYNETETMELIKEEGIAIGKLKALYLLQRKGYLLKKLQKKKQV